MIAAGPVTLLSAPQPSVPGEIDTSQPPSVLTPGERERVRASVDRALEYLAWQQQADGSFPTYDSGQPGVTALCLLAFLSAGHLPGEGEYGERINHGLDYVLSCQKPNGLICRNRPAAEFVYREASHTGTYNHAMSGLVLAEAYGMVDRERAERLGPAIRQALIFTRALQGESKRHDDDRGAWRYLGRHGYSDSDLSVTAWQLTFYRSAKNAGFSVPSSYADDALEFVERCFQRQAGQFLYALHDVERHPTRGMVGAGILTMILGGRADLPALAPAGDYLLSRPFNSYNVTDREGDRFHYGAFYCSQAMYQLGGRFWEGFYPVLVSTFLSNQRADGSWGPELGPDDIFGVPYATALGVLALTTPYQLLPVFQR